MPDPKQQADDRVLHAMLVNLRIYVCIGVRLSDGAAIALSERRDAARRERCNWLSANLPS